MRTENPDSSIGPSLLFSYWILAWFVIYTMVDPTTKWGKYIKERGSPIAAIWLSLFYGIASFIQLLLYNPKIGLLLNYAIMVLLLKVLPAYVLRDQYNQWLLSTMVLAGVFLLYNIYLYTQGTNIVKIYTETEKSIRLGENKTPFLAFLSSLFQ